MRETINVEMDPDRRPDYAQLVKALGGVDNKVAFLVAMMHGIRNNARKSLKRKVSYFRTSYLNAEDKCLIAAVALQNGVSEQDFSWEKAFLVAEEYSRGGIALLREELSNRSDFEKAFPLDVMGAAPDTPSTVDESEPTDE